MATARQPDVEQSPFLRDLLIALGESERQLLVFEAREEDRIELEAFGAVIGQQHHAATLFFLGEPRAQVPHERFDAGAAELLRQPQQACEVRLAGRLVPREILVRIRLLARGRHDTPDGRRDVTVRFVP